MPPSPRQGCSATPSRALPSSSRRYSSRPRRSSTRMMHHPPLPPGARPQSARRRRRPPASSRAIQPQAESIPWPARRASRRRAAPPAGNPEMLEFALSQETARTAPLLPLVEGQEENLPFLFRRWSKGTQGSMGRQCATPCFLTLAHDPFCQ